MKLLSPVLNLCYRGYLFLRGILHGGTIVASQMIVIRDAQVLLIKPTYRPHFEFPGGAVDRGETPVDAGVREAFEEASIRVEKVSREVGVFPVRESGTNVTIHVFLAEEWHEEGKWKPGWEIRERKFFPLHDLPHDISDFARETLENIHHK